MNPDRKSPLAIVFVSCLFLVISLSYARGLLFRSKTIHATGQVATLGVEVCTDPNCTVVLDSIDWGTQYPSQSRNTTFCVKLMGNTPSTLDLSTDNFAPIEAEQYLALTWDYDGHIVNPEDVSEVIVTLTVSSSIAGVESFSFDMIVTAYEVV